MAYDDDDYVDPYEQGASLFDWEAIQQFIISAFKGFGSLLDYFLLPAEDKKTRARVNGWIKNKVERSPDEFYHWEREEIKNNNLSPAEAEKAQNVSDEFDKLLNRYAEANPDKNWTVPEQYSTAWYNALEEANQFFTAANQKLNTEYQQTLAAHEKHKAEEKARLAALDKKLERDAVKTNTILKKSGNKYPINTHFSANTANENNRVTIDVRDHPLLVMLRDLESNGDYNIAYGGVNHDFTKGTIRDAINWLENNKPRGKDKNGNWQTYDFDNVGGAYMFKASTLKMLLKVPGIGIKDTEMFTEDMQDRLAMVLAERRGYGKFISGEITTAEELMRGNGTGKNRNRLGLAGEWAVLPYNEKNLSAYGENGIDAARITWDEVNKVLEACKNVDIAPNTNNGYTVGFPVFVDDIKFSPLGARDINDNGVYDPRPHRGHDFRVGKNTTVMAIADGVITNISTQINPDTGRGYGKRIALSHKGANGQFNAVSMAAHLNGYPDDLKVGDAVARGQTIGLSGDTGSDGSNHLHFETGFYVRDENDQLRLCMVSYGDIMEFNDRLHEPAVIAHLIDRAYIRHRGNEHYKDGVDGLACPWLKHIPENMRPTDLDALPAYDFAAAKTRLAPHVKKSTGYKTSRSVFPLPPPKPKAEKTVEVKVSEIKENSSSFRQEQNTFFFGNIITLPGNNRPEAL